MNGNAQKGPLTPEQFEQIWEEWVKTKDVTEVAQKLNVSENRVRNVVRKAKKWFKSELEAAKQIGDTAKVQILEQKIKELFPPKVKKTADNAYDEILRKYLSI